MRTAPRDYRAPRGVRRPVLWLALGLVMALTIALLVAVWVQYRPGREPVPDPRAVAAPAQAPDEAAERSFYSFGHSLAALDLSLRDGEVVEQRLPFRMSAEAERFRVHVRNDDFLEDRELGDVDLVSVYLGAAGEDGRFDGEGVRLAAEEAVTADGFRTGWFDAGALPLTPDREYLLGVSFNPRADAEVGLASGVGWIRQGTESGSMAEDGNRGDWVAAGTYLDLSIEYSLAEEDRGAPRAAVLGHSLNAGANQNPEVPHRGEESVWHQVWAREEGTTAASLAAPGSWTTQYAPGSPKWRDADQVDADVVAVWASSSDLVSGTDPEIVRGYWTSLIAEAERRWPGAKVVAFTEPPRGAEGEGEEMRRRWNDFLRTEPDAVDALVDADRLLADPLDERFMAAEWDGDGSHFGPEGHRLIAEAFGEAVDRARA